MNTRTAKVEELLGQTIHSIDRPGPCKDDDELFFNLEDGRKFRMHHYQDCCEAVTIEDVCGSFDDLIGSPLTLAEESTKDESPKREWAESWTWTFYRFATTKGYVTIRWYGESNGYYSESVNFEEILP